MMKDKLIQSVMTAFFILVANGSNAADSHDDTAAVERCYGVAKKGMNDCAAASCASSATKDGQKDTFILLPKGVCERIVGGSLTAEK